MTQHRIGTQEEWQAARDQLLAKEKELTRRNDELAQERRELPWVRVEKEYSFETERGTKTPADRPADGRGVRNRRGRLRLRGAGPERLRAIGRRRLPDLRDHRARPRARDGLLRTPRPHPNGAPRGRPAGLLAEAARRVRGGV